MMKTKFFSVIAFISTALTAGAQTEADNLMSAMGETEAVSCADLPEALRAYNQDAHLNQQALKFALRDAVNSLSISQADIIADSDYKAQLKDIQSDLLGIIEDLEYALFLSQANEMALSDISSSIEYSLEECLSRPPSSLAE